MHVSFFTSTIIRLFVLFTCLWMQAFSVQAQSTPDITPVVSGTPTVGTEYWVEIRVGNSVAVSDLYGLSLKLRSNSSNTTYVDGSAERGTLLGSSVIEFFRRVNDQTVDIAITKTSTPGVSGSGLFARARFKTLAAETVTFSFQDVSGYNSQGNSINFDPKSLSITVGSVTQNPVPVLTSLTPSSGEKGNNYSVTLTGSNFISNSTVNVSGSGVTVSGVSVVSANQITANFTVSSGASAGARSVTVTNPTPGGGTSSAVSFTVMDSGNPVPVLNGLTPSSGEKGNNYSVTLMGSNFISNSTVNVSGSGVTVSGVSVVNANQIDATFSISSSATEGTRNVTVTNPSPGGGTSSAVGFTVNSTPNPVPSLSSISPASAAPGSNTSVTLSGSNFVSGATINVSGSGVSVSNVTVASANQITATFSVSSGASTGARSVTVTNPSPGGGSSSAVNFTVTDTSNPLPVVQTISPEHGAPGAGVDVTITGANFATGITLQSMSGITISNLTRVSATQLTARFTIASAASLGARAIQVTNPAPGGGASNTNITFTVALPPPTPSTSWPTGTTVPTSSRPTFDWAAVSGATNYTVQVSTQNTFPQSIGETSNQANNFTVSYTVTDTKFQMPLALTVGNYFWRVRANTGSVNGVWSNPYSFLVVVAPSTPTLVSPANGATGLSSGVQLVWTPTTNTSSYHLQVSEGVAFTNLFLENDKITAPPFTLPNFISGNPIGFFWRVRSVGSGGNSEWSDVRYFTRAKLTSDHDEDPTLPKTLQLLPNYPNPFNPTTQIQYQIPTAGEVSLQLYATDGRWLQTLKQGYHTVGVYTYTLDASSLSSGRYFVVLQQGSERKSIQISLVK
jgi:hypothetical protein